MLLFEITVIVTLKTVYILVIKIVQIVVLPSILSFTLRTSFSRNNYCNQNYHLA